TVKKPDHGQIGLRDRSNRPCGGTANKCDELAPPHMPPLARTAKVSERLARGGHSGMRRDVRFGSITDIEVRSMNVRFNSKSGHWNSVGECPLCAKSGHCSYFGSTLTCCSTTTGRVNAKVEPWPGCDSTQIRPPCISIMRFDIARPRPVPPFLRVIALSACW